MQEQFLNEFSGHEAGRSGGWMAARVVFIQVLVFEVEL
jgi:hypothetical protein